MEYIHEDWNCYVVVKNTKYIRSGPMLPIYHPKWMCLWTENLWDAKQYRHQDEAQKAAWKTKGKVLGFNTLLGKLVLP